MKLELGVLLVLTHVLLVLTATCPYANPNDQEPDDVYLQKCLDQGGVILLDPGNPGYIIDSGLFITVNTTTISSSAAPQKVTLLAGANLTLPMLETTGIIFNIVLEYLIVDGNKDNREAMSKLNCNSGDNKNYLTSNIMLPGYVEGDGFDAWNPYVYVSNVVVHDVDSINSPCGTGIGMNGRGFEIYHCNISNNGWDGFNNPQKLFFPLSDGINAAVCSYGHIHDNYFLDNTNMQITAGPGPYCLVENNVIVQTNVVAQNSINVWPTNVWMKEPVWWHPAPFDFAHSSIRNNIISSTNDVTAGAYSGIAVAALPWANFSVLNSGLIYNNTISGANVNLLVDGAFSGTIYGNTLFGAQNTSGKTAKICKAPQDYTVAKSAGLFLQPGYSVLSFDLGRSCFPTGETIVSTLDDSKFAYLSINDTLLPVTFSGAPGAELPVAISFINTGTSVWQDIAGDAGYKVGDAINQATPVWGTMRGMMYDTIVYPGGEFTFQFTITLPSTPGSYTFQWQMVQEGIQWFGQATPPVVITVN